MFLNYWWLVISMLPILPSHFPFWLILKKGFYSTSSNSNKTSTNYKVQYTSFFFFLRKKKYNTHQFYYFSYTKTPHPEVEHNQRPVFSPKKKKKSIIKGPLKAKSLLALRRVSMWDSYFFYIYTYIFLSRKSMLNSPILSKPKLPQKLLL